jgi:lipoprotein-releasing system permease protein
MLARKLALKYLAHPKGFGAVVSGFALAGLTLGVAALLVVLAVMAGLRTELLNRMLGVNGHLTVSLADSNLQSAEVVAEAVREKVSAVTDAMPFIQGQALVLQGGKSNGVLVRGQNILPPYLQKKEQGADDHIVRGLTIGDALAEKLGLQVGDSLTLLAPQGTPTPFGFMPNLLRFEVSSIFDSGLNEYDNSLIFMRVEQAQKLLQLGDKVSALELHITNPDDARDVAKLVQAVTPAFSIVRSWQEQNQSFFQALEVERVAMFMILSLVVLIAAFNIITGQMMLVGDKRNDIAILRSFGARRGQISLTFLLTGGLLGAIGTLLGTILGVIVIANLQSILAVIEHAFGIRLFSGDAYFLDSLPAKLQMGDALLVIILALGLSLLASWLPARTAARVNPVDILRGSN